MSTALSTAHRPRGAVTAVGIAAMIVSTMYDYRLQTELLAKTATLHGPRSSGSSIPASASRRRRWIAPAGVRR